MLVTDLVLGALQALHNLGVLRWFTAGQGNIIYFVKIGVFIASIYKFSSTNYAGLDPGSEEQYSNCFVMLRNLAQHVSH